VRDGGGFTRCQATSNHPSTVRELQQLRTSDGQRLAPPSSSKRQTGTLKTFGDDVTQIPTPCSAPNVRIGS
jgi:hypothetical protein